MKSERSNLKIETYAFRGVVMKLNKIQKAILIIYALVVLGLCVYVPWIFNNVYSTEYSVIWSPPTAFSGLPARLDSSRLFFELFAVTIFFGVAVVVAHKHN
jgi:ABC-type sugar transport system permease subunit